MRDAWYAVSTDGGVTTSAPRRMGGTPLLENVVPRAIAASRNDVVYLAWEGRRSSEVLYPGTLGLNPVEATVETTLTFGPRTPEVR
jgi:hypothetical protein